MFFEFINYLYYKYKNNSIKFNIMSKRIRRKLSDATKFKMRLAKLGAKNPMSGKHHTEDAKRKISKKLKDYWRLIPIE